MISEELQAKIEATHDEILKEWKDKRNFKELFVEKVGKLIKELSQDKK